MFNKALLGHFATERDSLWRNIITAKFGSMVGDWITLPSRGSFGVSLFLFFDK